MTTPLPSITLSKNLDVLFRDFSKTEFAMLIKESFTRQSSGSTFTTMFNYEEACDAVKASNGINLLGRIIKVVLAETQRRPIFSIQYWS